MWFSLLLFLLCKHSCSFKRGRSNGSFLLFSWHLSSGGRLSTWLCKEHILSHSTSQIKLFEVKSWKRIVFPAFFPTSPSPALSICWFCQALWVPHHISRKTSEAKMHPRQERCPLRLFLCLECKTQQCFSSPPIGMVMSSQGSCQRRQQPPGASHTTLLSWALVFVGSGLHRTMVKVFFHQLGDRWLDAAGKSVFSVHMCICRHAKYMHLGTSSQS